MIITCLVASRGEWRLTFLQTSRTNITNLQHGGFPLLRKLLQWLESCPRDGNWALAQFLLSNEREHNNVRLLLQNTAVCRHLTEHAPCPSSLDGLAWAGVPVGLRGVLQSTPMLTVLFLCCYPEHRSCFLLFSNFSATASSFLQTGAFGA